MNEQPMNLFIVDSHKAAADKLELSLYNRFGKDLNITTFFRGENCLEKVDATTNFVVLAYFFDDQNGNDILRKIKEINPKTEVIMLSSNTDVGAIVESLRSGATSYIVKGESAWRKLVPYVYNAIADPIRRFGKEYGPAAYIAMFTIAFASVGAGSFLLMKMFSH